MRLSVLAGVAASLALLNAAEAFAPTGGVWLQTPARASLRPRIAAPTMLLEDCTQSKRSPNHHKNPTLGFKPSFSSVRQSGKHFLQEEDVRKEVMENVVESSITKYDHQVYKMLSQSSHALANNFPSIKKILPMIKSLPPLDVPAGADLLAHKVIHAAIHAGHLAFVPALLLIQGVVLFYAAVLHRGNATPAEGSSTECKVECEDDMPFCLPGEEGPQCCCC